MPKNKYLTTAHAKTSIRYHIIFSTKYRRKCLDEIRDIVLNSFRYVESISHFKILYMNLEKDHIHFLITWKPSLSITQVVSRMKQISTNYIYKNEIAKEHLKKFYWGKKKKLWTGGYFVSTIGEVSEKTLKEYIEKQG
jgi:putative transposase